MRGRRFFRYRTAWVLAIAPAMAVAGLTMATAGQAAVHSPAASLASHVRQIKPNAVNQVDCNGYSTKYKALKPGGQADCTDMLGPHHLVKVNGKWVIRGSRHEDNGHYIGHDEPSVKFISSAANSGNTMTYLTKLPVDPRRQPTANGRVTDYAEQSVAPWFGLPLCDPHSYPQNPCTPDSDSNLGSITNPADAGSAFMELQFYAPGFAPFPDNVSCSAKQWCAAMTIDSVASQFNFVNINPACQEPVNFAFLQRNGVPAGPPSPQLANVDTHSPNTQTLKMNPGDVLQVSITDPAAGFTTTVKDLTTGQTGFMVASAAKGFAGTDFTNCNGIPFTFHAEYATAAQQNQVPWASLEGGVLMQQEIGHGENCNSVAHRFPVTSGGGSTSFSDPKVFQTCMGGSEGRHAVGEGPCNPNTGVCHGATTEGTTGPIACPSNNAASGQLCEFSDGLCFPKGTRTVMINGKARKETQPVATCLNNLFQNGNLDFGGTSYRNDWPNGSKNHPTSFRYIGPFDASGHLYPQIQFETDTPQSEFLCHINNGLNCQLPPLGAKFYPYWTLNNTQHLGKLGTPAHTCVWNFGSTIPGLTKKAFGKDAQYGTPDLARFGGTATSPILTNPATAGGCPNITMP
jgi:hypothetical protein